MRDPFRVAVWGPGNVGKCIIRECSLMKEMELVAVLAYDRAKDGVDAGTLAGVAPMGVSITTDPVKVIAAKPEVVLHCPRDFGDFAADAEILRLLEAGINVVSCLPYFYPATRGDAVAKRFEAAGKLGGATLYGTGTNPSTLFERVVPQMLAFSNGVESISLQEVFEFAELGPDTSPLMQALGMGLDAKDLDPNGAAGQVADNYFRQDVMALAVQLGKSVSKIVRQDFNALAPHDLCVPGMMTVKKGKVGMLSCRWDAYCDGEPFVRTQMYWYYTEAMKPKLIDNSPPSYWLVEIEGRPSLRAVLEMNGSFKRSERYHRDNPANWGFITTAVAMLQAVPHVIAAEPGIMLTKMPDVRWKPDQRAT